MIHVHCINACDSLMSRHLCNTYVLERYFWCPVSRLFVFTALRTKTSQIFPLIFVLSIVRDSSGRESRRCCRRGRRRIDFVLVVCLLRRVSQLVGLKAIAFVDHTFVGHSVRIVLSIDMQFNYCSLELWLCKSTERT